VSPGEWASDVAIAWRARDVSGNFSGVQPGPN
jgi:hypothetical protein